MHGELKDYRQPMVTPLGILLGFILNFLAGWGIRTGEPIIDATDAVILGTTILAVFLMIYTLYRMLNSNVPEEKVARYYRTTLRFYLGSVVLAFSGFLIAILL